LRRRVAKFITLYSGSSGNSTLVSDNGTSLLVDMGRSCRSTVSALYSIGVAASDINAILITHEHTDHVSGLMTFLKHYSVPVFGTGRTLEHLRRHNLTPPHARLIDIDALSGFEVGAISVDKFTTSHDSEDSVGYRFTFGSGATASIATDLGYVSPEVLDALSGCDVVALESNYDETKLVTGRYPYYLKQRIMSNTGHLSNDDCARAASILAKRGTRRLVLVHLSRENNEPEIALTTCLSNLENCGAAESIKVSVAPRFDVGELIEV